MAKTKETELRDDYDLLEANEQRLFEEIGSHGFKPVKEDDQWTASNGKGLGIGPYPLIAQLHAGVMDEVFNPENIPASDNVSAFKGRNKRSHPTREPVSMKMSDGDGKVLFEGTDEEFADMTAKLADANDAGEPYLPGAQEFAEVMPDIPVLRQPCLELHAVETEFTEIQKRYKEAKTVVDMLLHNHKNELPFDVVRQVHYFKVVNPDDPNTPTVRVNLEPGKEKITTEIEGSYED